MANPPNRLKFDLSFLERAPASEETHLAQTKYKYNWRNIGIIAAIVVGVGYLMVSSDSSHTASNAPIHEESSPSSDGTASTQSPLGDDQSSSDTTSVNGQYRCSHEDSVAADQLKPTDSKEDVDAAREELDKRQDEIRQLKSDIDSGTTDENSSQSEIDEYNDKVSEFNSKLDSLKSDQDAFEARKSAFNDSVEAYNNYLQSHCRGP